MKLRIAGWHEVDFGETGGDASIIVRPVRLSHGKGKDDISNADNRVILTERVKVQESRPSQAKKKEFDVMHPRFIDKGRAAPVEES